MCASRMDNTMRSPHVILYSCTNKIHALYDLTHMINTLLQFLSREEDIAVRAALRPHRFSMDQTVIAQGSKDTSLYFIAMGTCEVYINGVLITTLRAGAFTNIS